jgi:hypothetical protein
MSQAFVKESDGEWLHDVAPSLSALVIYLTRENNGVRVYQKQVKQGRDGREMHLMSNGLTYAKDSGGKWEIVF